MTEFLESLRNKVDGPKLPFHLDYEKLPDTILWYVTATTQIDVIRSVEANRIAAGPFVTPKEAEAERDRLNKLFRDEGAGGELPSS